MFSFDIENITKGIGVVTAIFAPIGAKHSMIKTSSMNKSTKRGYKKYRGQGK